MDRNDRSHPSKNRDFSDSGPGGFMETVPLKHFTKLKHGRLIPSKSKWYSHLYAYNWLLNARGPGMCAPSPARSSTGRSGSGFDVRCLADGERKQESATTC